jgi:hypothetical protein
MPGNAMKPRAVSALLALGLIAFAAVPAPAAVPADTTWSETVRIPVEAVWIAGTETPPESLACRFASGAFTVNGIRLFRKCGDPVSMDPKTASDLRTIPRVQSLLEEGKSFRDAAAIYNDEIDSLLTAAAQTYETKGPAAAMVVLESSDLIDEALVTGYREIRIRRAGRGKEWKIYPSFIREEEAKPGKALLVLDRLRELSRWPSPPKALIITSAGEVVPLSGTVEAARDQVKFLLSGGDPASLPPGPIWKSSEDVICDFLAAARRARER